MKIFGRWWGFLMIFGTCSRSLLVDSFNIDNGYFAYLYEVLYLPPLCTHPRTVIRGFWADGHGLTMECRCSWCCTHLFAPWRWWFYTHFFTLYTQIDMLVFRSYYPPPSLAHPVHCFKTEINVCGWYCCAHLFRGETKGWNTEQIKGSPTQYLNAVRSLTTLRRLSRSSFP